MLRDPISILFFGTPEFAADILSALIHSDSCLVRAVVTGEDKAAGRGNKMTLSPVKELALAENIPVLQPASIKKQLSDFLKSAGPLGPFDIGVVAAFGQILPIEAISIPFHACVNVHASLLPRWRGAAPVQRAIMEGDLETGVCIMEVAAGLDSGGIFSRESIPILPEDDSGTLLQKLSKIGGNLLLNALPLICAGELPAQPQPEHGVTYAHKLKKDEELIHWTEDAERIRDRIRALAPAPGAYSFSRGKRIKILKASCTNASDICAAPGEIIALDRSRLEVACRRGAISLLELQPEGKRRMPVRDFLAGAALRIGGKLECPGNAES